MGDQEIRIYLTHLPYSKNNASSIIHALHKLYNTAVINIVSSYCSRILLALQDIDQKIRKGLTSVAIIPASRAAFNPKSPSSNT